MNKSEYMKILTHELRRLPKEDYYRAVDYFEEYFAEAGPENEDQAIRDLGSPEEAAKSLIMDLAAENASKPPKTVKRGLSAIWIGILAVCAAPVALPLALAVAILVLAAVAVVGIILFCIVLCAVCLTAGGIVTLVSSGFLIFHSVGDTLCNAGMGLIFTGFGILIAYGAILFFRFIITKISKGLAKAMKGGRKK